MPTAADLLRASVKWTTGSHVLVWLALALVPAFSLTAFVTRAHREHQRALAAEWEMRGRAALEAGEPREAIDAFRNALRFAREDRDLRLRLGESLAAAGRVSEARAYLLGLWQDQPGSGRVNLQLARLAAREGDQSSARLYYHDAIEGAWSDAAEERRRSARFELSEYLVSQGAGDAAEIELIALAADLPPEIEGQLRVATLLSRAGVHRRALALFDQILKQVPGDSAALIGAGQAAFALRNYAAAVRYLGRVPKRNRGEAAAEMLETSTLVLALDPYRRGLSSRERAARALRALEAAENRLAACVSQAVDLAALHGGTVSTLKANTRNALARDPDRLDAVTNLAFRAEQAAEGRCGPPAPIDRALLLLGAPPGEGGP
jgi:tetratricopeptide (TPR) repeat protein